MLERFVHDPLPYILGLTAFLILLGLLGRIAISIVRFTHNLMDKIEFVEKEMKEDGGKSLKDYAMINDQKMAAMTKSLQRVEQKLRSIEGRLPK